MSEDNICMQEKNACMCERKYSGNGRSMVETEGRSLSRCDWLRRSSGAGSCSEFQIQINMMEGDESVGLSYFFISISCVGLTCSSVCNFGLNAMHESCYINYYHSFTLRLIRQY